MTEKKGSVPIKARSSRAHNFDDVSSRSGLFHFFFSLFWHGSRHRKEIMKNWSFLLYGGGFLLGNSSLLFFILFFSISHTPRDYRLVAMFGDGKHWQHFFTLLLFRERIFFPSFCLRSGWHTTMRTPESIFWRRRKYSTTSSSETSSESRPSRVKIFPLACVYEKGQRERERRKLRWSSRFVGCVWMSLRSWHLWKILEVHSNPLSSCFFFFFRATFYVFQVSCHFELIANTTEIIKC